MAILFVSHKKKNRIFFWSMSAFVIALLMIISFLAFPYDFLGLEQPSDDVSLPPLQVNFDILDSNALEALEPFSEVKAGGADVGRNEPFAPY